MGIGAALAAQLDLTATLVMPERRQAAYGQIQSFLNGAGHSAWTTIERPAVAANLTALVADPARVQQGTLGVCGPAAFLRCWIERDPSAFVTFAVDLYQQGKARLGEQVISANDELRAVNYAQLRPRLGLVSDPSSVCEVAEWMVMSSLIDTANTVLDYHGNPDESKRDGSTAESMEQWFKGTHLYSSVTGVATFTWHSLRELSSLRPSADCDVVMVVSADLLLSSSRAGTVAERISETLSTWWTAYVGRGDHFVRLMAPVRPSAAAPGKLDLDVWSWGEPYPLRAMDPDTLEQSFNGAIVGQV